MKVKIITDIIIEPITLDEVKEALKITGSGHDTELERLISDARAYIERAIDTSVLERTLEVTSEDELEDWELPFGPVSNLVKTTDSDGNYVYTYTGGDMDCPPEIQRLITMLIKHWYDIDDEAVALPEAIKKGIQLRTRQPGL
jgi:hypothetical protein